MTERCYSNPYVAFDDKPGLSLISGNCLPRQTFSFVVLSTHKSKGLCVISALEIQINTEQSISHEAGIILLYFSK